MQHEFVGAFEAAEHGGMAVQVFDQSQFRHFETLFDACYPVRGPRQ
jgi:hypothetical protein